MVTDAIHSKSVAANVAALEAMAAGREVGEQPTHARAITEQQLRQAGMLGPRSGSTLEKLRSPYEQVAVVNRCIQIIADAVKSMPLVISTANDQIVEAGDVIDLMNEPYPGITGEDMVEWISALIPLTGSSNLIKNDDPYGVGSLDQRIHTLRPVGGDRCQPYYDARTGDLLVYRYYRPGTGTVQELSPERVIRWTRSNYASQRFADGLSSLRPSEMAIQQVFGADRANLSNLNSGIIPSLHMKFPRDPGPDKVNQAREFVREHNSGPDNAGEPLITWDGVEIEGLLKDFSKMLHDKLKLMSIVDVCVCMGVPPAVLGYVAEGGLGQPGKETEAAHTIFWQATVLPLANWIARRFTIDVLPHFGMRSSERSAWKTRAIADRQSVCPTYRAASHHARGFRTWRYERGERRLGPTQLFAWFDSSNVQAIIDAQMALIEKGKVLIETYAAPPADVIEAFDMPLTVHPWQRTATRNISQVPVDEPLPTDPAATGAMDDSQTIAEAEEEVGATTGNDDALTVIRGAQNRWPEYRRLDQRVLRVIWRAWYTSWSPIRARAEKVISRHWIERRSQVLVKINKAFSGRRSLHEANRRDIIGEILFDIVPGSQGHSLSAKLLPYIRNAAQLGGDQVLDEARANGMQITESYKINGETASTLIRQRVLRISSIEANVRRRLGDAADAVLRDALAKGLDAGQTAIQLTDMVRHQFGIVGNRASIVARNEIGAAVDEHRQLGRDQALVPSKSWLSSRKPTGRANHLATEAETMERPVPNDSDFVIAKSGERCMHPRDSRLSAKEVVNCTCTAISRYPNDNLRSVIATYVQRGFLMPDGQRSIPQQIQQRNEDH